MQLTENFKLSTLTRSATAENAGIENTPTEAQIEALRWLCVKILEPIVKNKGKVVITSGYRSPAVNKLTGGSATSQHSKGEAADIVVPGLTVEELFTWIKNSALPYDQVIQEFNKWVHVSYSRENTRRMAMRATKPKLNAIYTPV